MYDFRLLLFAFRWSLVDFRYLFVITQCLLLSFALLFIISAPVSNLSGQTLNSGMLKYPWTGGLNSCQFGAVDLNLDGIDDLVIFDRMGNRILPFLNSGAPGMDGYSLHTEYVDQFPDLHDWVMFADYNRDGKRDIFTYSLGGMRVFLNISDSVLAFKPVTSLLKSFYYTGYVGILLTPVDYPAIDDIDGDGDLDILTFFGLGSYVEYHKNLSMEKFGNSDSLDYKLSDHCWGNFKESEGSNEVTLNIVCPYKNSILQGLSCREDPPKHTGSTILATDLDGNGTSDLILGDVDFPNLISLLNGGSTDTAQMTSQDTAFPSNTLPVKLFSFPAASFLDMNNDGKKDLVISPFDASLNISDNFRSVWFYENSGTDSLPVFKFMTDRFFLNEMIDVGSCAFPVFHDLTGDGLPDLIIGNYGYYDSSYYENAILHSVYKSKIAFYKNTGTHMNPAFHLETDDFAGISELKLLGVYPAFGDLDDDGDADMILGNSDGKLIYFNNTAGTGKLPVYSPPQFNYHGIDVGEYSSPQLFDLDKDQKPDLIIGEEKGNLNYYHNSGSVANPIFSFVTDSLGKVNVTNYTLSYDGFSTPWFFTDNYNNTGLLVGAEEGKVHYFTDIDNNLAGIFQDSDSLLESITGATLQTNPGWRTSACIANISDPVFMDLVVGNYSGGLNYYSHNSLPEVISSVREIRKKKEGIFMVYPNPADGYVTIESSSVSTRENFSIQIINLFGNIVFEQAFHRHTTVNTESLQPGVYIIRIGDVSHKLCISR
jgi:hypothetical protein